MKYIYVLLTFCLFSVGLHAQREATWWYFGNNSGLDFTEVLNGTAMYPKFATEGLGWGPIATTNSGASIADKDGNFLFATNGMKLYGRDRREMPNGGDLPGEYRNSQTALAIPVPGDLNRYYIVIPPKEAQQAGASAGGAPTYVPMTYSVIDMTFNGGLGDVVPGMKNIPINQGGLWVEGNIAAVEHDDGVNYWLASRSGDKILAWKVTASGFEAPVISQFGYQSDPTKQSNLAKTNFSPNGKWLFSNYATTSESLLFLGRFDNRTGMVSDGHKIKASELGVNSSFTTMEFSPNSMYLYSIGIFNNPDRPTSTIQGIYRLDLSEFPNFTRATPIVWDKITDPSHAGYQGFFSISRLSIAPDGKVYGVGGSTRQLWAMHNPNVGGTDMRLINKDFFPSYNDTGFQPGVVGTHHTPVIGLPFFIASFFKINPITAPDAVCFGTTVNFSVDIKQVTGIYRLSKIVWDFGDGHIRESSDFSNLTHTASHTYAAPGNYLVQVIPYYAMDGQPAASDITTHQITVNPIPVAAVAANPPICSGTQATLQAALEPDPNIVARWHREDGTFLHEGVNYTTEVLHANTTYRLDALNRATGCFGSTYVTVTVNPLPSLSVAGADVCMGESAVLRANIDQSDPNIVVNWYKMPEGTPLGQGVELNTGPLTTTTEYHVHAYNTATGCLSVVSVVATVHPKPTISATGATVCVGQSAILRATIDQSNPSLVANWYKMPEGIPLGQGIELNTGPLNVTTEYHVHAYNTATNCWSGIAVTVTVNQCRLSVNPHIQSGYK